MTKSRFSEAQIVSILKEVGMGDKVGETCIKHGISDAITCKWKSQCAGMTVSHLAQLRELQDENSKLKRVHADLGSCTTRSRTLLSESSDPRAS